MREFVRRWAVAALIVVVGTAVGAPPVLADSASSAPQKPSLSTLSSASLTLLRVGDAPVRAQQSGASSESFFKTTKGKAAIGLMVAGAAFTIWSVNHDRKPVKSAIR